MTIIHKHFGQFVRERRFLIRLGLREFCILLDLDPSNWSKLERGKLRPPSDMKTLNRIAVALRIDNQPRILRQFYAMASVGWPKLLSAEYALLLEWVLNWPNPNGRIKDAYLPKWLANRCLEALENAPRDAMAKIVAADPDKWPDTE